MKILAIGNSFSIDAMQWLYNIAESAGIKDVVLGNLYIGGCSLETHHQNTESNKAAYTYFRNVDGTWQEYNDKTMLDGIKDELWDIITMQQASGYSAIQDSYEPYLANLINYVNRHKKIKRLNWHGI